MERACEFLPEFQLRQRYCFREKLFFADRFRAKDVDPSAGWEFALSAA